MQSGLIDGAEFVGPGSDIALGLYRVATFYYAPGFNKPNGTGECILSLKAWETLDSEMKAIVQHACGFEAAFALAEMERLNTDALAALCRPARRQDADVSAKSDRGCPPARQRTCLAKLERTGRSARKIQRILYVSVSETAPRHVVAHLDQGGAGAREDRDIDQPSSLLVRA